MFSFHHVLAGMERPQAIIDSKHFFVLSHLSGPQPKGFLGFEGGRGDPLEPSLGRARTKVKGKEGIEDSWDQKEF